MTVALETRIEMDPKICGGQPCVAGRRIRVQDVVIWHEEMGLSAAEIAAEYDLQPAETYAALSYYHEHREEVDQAMQEADDQIEAMRAKIPSKLNS